MITGTDIIELKFEGDGIKPELVKASELGVLLQEFERAILSNLKRENPAIDITQRLLVLQAIEDKSVGINFKQFELLTSDIKQIILSSYISLAACIDKGDYTYFNEQTIKSLKQIVSFSKRYSCTATFKQNGQFLATVNGNTEIKQVKHLLKSDTTIYGELYDAGGDNPNVHIKINDDYSVTVDTDKPTAKILASRLYEQIGLKGSAKFDAATSKIVEFKLREILDYSPGKTSSIMRELKNELSGYWDKFNNDRDINNQLLRE